jgi:hypothetical protein
MARLVVKCMKCEYQESVISTKPGADLPPCPRCDGFVRMSDVTPMGEDLTKTWSTAGSQDANPTAPSPAPPVAPVAPPVIKRRDQRDFGPEPRN